jgi:hypothetical protein
MQRSSSETLDARDHREIRGDRHDPRSSLLPEHLLELTTAAVLERIGLRLNESDAAFVRSLVPFVIDPESLYAIPPLASLPSEYTVHPAMGDPASGSPDVLSYQNIPLQPVPVLAPALTHLLIGRGEDLEVEFIDGDNVYGANVFERHEGRRLLRRAISYVYRELDGDGVEFHIIVHEADGFLIVRRRQRGGESLRNRLRHIIASMRGKAGDDDEDARTRARLATFYRQARTALLAPATVSYESRDDRSLRIGRSDIYPGRTLDERFARLESAFPHLTPLVASARHRPLHEQPAALTLMEHRMYDAVLQTLADELGNGGCHVRAFKHPGELLRHLENRPVTFHRLELVSLLKSINEHPSGGFLAGNEVLRAIFKVLVQALQDERLWSAQRGHAEICAFRRWSDFFFAVDETRARERDVRNVIEAAFGGFKYVVVEAADEDESPYRVTLSDACPPCRCGRLVMPLIPTVTRERHLSADMFSMPIEEPGRKLLTIAQRLAAKTVADVDVLFLADWTLNACDPKRGVPRLVDLVGATDDDIQALTPHYESFVNRKGCRQHRLRRDAAVIAEFREKLAALVARRRA